MESLAGPSLDQGQTRMCVGYAGWAFLKIVRQQRRLTDAIVDPGSLYNYCKQIDGLGGEGTTLRAVMDVMRKRFLLGETVRVATASDMREALSTQRPVLLGAKVDFTNLRGMTPLKCVLDDQDGFDGAHAMVVVGYDQARDAFRVRNSYGIGWADTGHCWLTPAYLAMAPFDAWTVADA